MSGEARAAVTWREAAVKLEGDGVEGGSFVAWCVRLYLMDARRDPWRLLRKGVSFTRSEEAGGEEEASAPVSNLQVCL